MSRDLTPLVLAQRSLNTDNIRHTPTPSLLRIIPYLGGKLTDITGQVDDDRRTSLSPDTMTLLVFIHDALPLVRKIRADRIIDVVRNFN
jgi:hypothetical protein